MWIKIANDAIHSRGDFDPGPMIEERVLRQLERNMNEKNTRRYDLSIGRDKKKRSKDALPPTATPDLSALLNHPGTKSLADEIDRLRALHDQGVLNDDQFSKAVDRVLAEG